AFAYALPRLPTPDWPDLPHNKRALPVFPCYGSAARKSGGCRRRNGSKAEPFQLPLKALSPFLMARSPRPQARSLKLQDFKPFSVYALAEIRCDASPQGCGWRRGTHARTNQVCRERPGARRQRRLDGLQQLEQD